MGCCGTSRKDLVFWDNRMLKLIEMEVGTFLIFCQFKN